MIESLRETKHSDKDCPLKRHPNRDCPTDRNLDKDTHNDTTGQRQVLCVAMWNCKVWPCGTTPCGLVIQVCLSPTYRNIQIDR